LGEQAPQILLAPLTGLAAPEQRGKFLMKGGECGGHALELS